MRLRCARRDNEGEVRQGEVRQLSENGQRPGVPLAAGLAATVVTIGLMAPSPAAAESGENASALTAPASERSAPGGSLPERLDYEDGDPVPSGYSVESSRHYDVAVAGALTLAVSYVQATVTAAVTPTMNSGMGGGGGKIAEAEQVWPLYLPVVGPFIALGTAEGGMLGAVVAGAVLESLGFALLVGGLAVEQRELVRVGTGATELWMTPSAGVGWAGLVLGGSL